MATTTTNSSNIPPPPNGQVLSLVSALSQTANHDLHVQAIAARDQALAEPQKARESYGRALEISREVGNGIGEASALNNLGMLVIQQERPQVAVEPAPVQR